MADIQDLRSTIIPRSDQLNSEQLLGGPMIITVSEVRLGSGEEQPVSIFYDADPARPFKPCKTMRKVLILAWGPDGTQWVGKSMELYCDPSVKFGGEVVGGIRISRLSDIPRDIKVSLTATKGRKAMHEIRPLTASPELTKVLAAITAATNGESMKKARALAESTLTADADVAVAAAAYKKKATELKAKPPAPAPSASAAFDAAEEDGEEIAFSADQVEERIKGASSVDVLDMAREQIAGVKDEAARLRLTELADKRDVELLEAGQ
jgi:hypothetical protein